MKSPNDDRDWVFENFAKGMPKVLPRRFMLPDQMPSREQGTRGTCAAFVACVIREIATMRTGEADAHMLSPEFVYWHRDNKPASGMYGRAVMKIMQRWGISPEHLYEYSSADPVNPPSAIAYACAITNRISKYARVTTIEGLKLSLVEVGAAYMLLPLYDTRPNFWQGTENRRGCHAVAVIGYDEYGFKLKNSWGEEWNGDGCVFIPYEDWYLVYECWTAMINYDEDHPGWYLDVTPDDPLNTLPLAIAPIEPVPKPKLVKNTPQTRSARIMSDPVISIKPREPMRRPSLGYITVHSAPALSDKKPTSEEIEQAKKCSIM